MPYHRDHEYVPYVCDCSEDAGLTHQSFKETCDINNVMSRYQDTGDLRHIAHTLPQYGDFSNVVNYHEAVNQVKQAQRDFAELPVKLRRRFHDDPHELIEFMSDKDNLDEARELGLAPSARDLEQTSPDLDGTPAAENSPSSEGETTPD